MYKYIVREILHFFGLFLLSLAIVLPIRQFIIQPFLVRGDSMLPNFNNFDYLFVEQVSYYFREPARGEVVVFRFPRNKRDYFIKRVIGLPGERINIEKGEVIVTSKDGKRTVLEEPYLTPRIFTEGSVDIQLALQEYYVLGDNRGASFDSRRWGTLPREDIVGRVLIRAWPPTKVKAFWGENYEASLAD